MLEIFGIELNDDDNADDFELFAINSRRLNRIIDLVIIGSMETTDESRTESANFSLEEDVDLSNITPMPKHVFLNTLPGHLAPFQTIPRSRYDTDRTKQEFYGQESSLNSFITTHCRGYSGSSANGGANDNQQQRSQSLSEVQSTNSNNGSMLKRNQCSVCTRVFANPASLKQHMRLHLGEKPFKCRYCDKTSATMCNILTHERTHTHERPYKCLVCSADFSSSSNLKTHMRIHSGDRPFRCNICDRRFVTSNALTTHLRVHWGLRLHPCSLCDRQFSTSSNLRVHHRTGNILTSSLHPSIMTPKLYHLLHLLLPSGFTIITDLELDCGTAVPPVTVHLGIKQYQCSVCGKAFATSSNLNAHSRQHPESAYIVKYSPPSPSTTTNTTTTTTTVLSQSHPTQSFSSYPTISMTRTNASANNMDIVSTPLNHQSNSASLDSKKKLTLFRPSLLKKEERRLLQGYFYPPNNGESRKVLIWKHAACIRQLCIVLAERFVVIVSGYNEKSNQVSKISITPAIQHQGITIMAPVEVNASLSEEQGESNSVVGLLTSTTSYNPAPTLIPVALSPNPAVRKMAKVSVYCPNGVETTPSSSQQQQQQQSLKIPPEEVS
ncbi:hypothetical protein ACTXT7_013312 [Hymenolepis weldensis]